MKITKKHYEDTYRNYDSDTIHQCFVDKREFERFKYILKKFKKQNYEISLSLSGCSNNNRIITNMHTRSIIINISYNAYAYLITNASSRNGVRDDYDALISMYFWIKQDNDWDGLGLFIARQTKYFTLKEAGVLKKRKENKETNFVI